MMKTLSKLGMAALLGAMLALPAQAMEPVALEAPEAPDALLGVLGAPAVGDEALSGANGREYLAINAAELNSVHGFNEANGAQSGSATIAAGALSDFHGAAAVVVNSGHNAVVQVSQQVIFNLY